MGGRAVRCGVCVCATATKDRSQDHWACIINNEGALKKKKKNSPDREIASHQSSLPNAAKGYHIHLEKEKEKPLAGPLGLYY